jgi:glycosyltransferase involved in cell wall biosynthesis
MNILYICDEYPPGRHGGIGTSVQVLAREMARQGHHVVVAGFYDWGYGGEDVFDDQGVKVYRFRRKLAAPLFKKQDKLFGKILYKLLNITRVFEADIKASMKDYGRFLENLIREHHIEVAEIPDYLDYVRFCRSYVAFPKLSVPSLIKLNGSFTYFAREEGSFLPQHIWQMDHDHISAGEKVCGVSKYTADKTAAYINYGRTIDVVHNAIDTKNYNAVAGALKKRNKVTYTGTLVRKKGIYQLAQAWNRVIEQRPDAELWVYGKGDIQKVVSYLSPAAKDSVKFPGHVSREQLALSLAESNIAIFPSYAECFALAPMEAMACGTAVIFSRRTSGPELIQHNENGLLIEPDNINEIAENILHLLNNPAECDRLAAKGQEHVRQNLDAKIIAGQNLEHYKRLVNKT